MGQNKEHGLIFGQLVQPLDFKSMHHIWVKSGVRSARALRARREARQGQAARDAYRGPLLELPCAAPASHSLRRTCIRAEPRRKGAEDPRPCYCFVLPQQDARAQHLVRASEHPRTKEPRSITHTLWAGIACHAPARKRRALAPAARAGPRELDTCRKSTRSRAHRLRSKTAAPPRPSGLSA